MDWNRVRIIELSDTDIIFPDIDSQKYRVEVA